MSNHPKNVAEAFSFIVEKVEFTAPPNQVERILNELATVYYRFVLSGLGWKRASYTAKLTAEEKYAADAFAATLPLKALLQLSAAMEKGFELAHASQSSQGTYGSRMRSAKALIESEIWYPGNAILNRRSPDECRPRMRHGRGDWHSLSLMEEKGKPVKYRIDECNILPTLQDQLERFCSFMTDIHNLDRCFDELEESTASGYHNGVRLWLGWLLRYDNPMLTPAELTLEHLIPKITQDSLESLSAKQQKQAWLKEQRILDERITRYFAFLRKELHADSPRTRLLKIATLLMVAKFLYADEIEDKEDYKGIPIIRTLKRRIDSEQKAVKQWGKDRRYVADQSRKWPEPPTPGQTVLEYTQEAVITPLRLECRPRQSTGDFCKGQIIAKSLMLYLLVVDVGLLPPGRQQELCSYRIALSCPAQRPDTVPIDGLYWPLPPAWTREKRLRDGSIKDNYLYKVYYHDGQFYEQGVWVRERCKYKTDKHHGKRIGVIDNFRFDDGSCLYDYIERYLCGQWYAGAFQNGHRYDWWDAALRGSYGKWLSHGRAEFFSETTPVFVHEGKSAEVWVASYLFLNPTDGQPFKDVQMSSLFARNAYRILGKRITPHTFRYMWATWAYQMELSDAELRSLAHGMGLTVETLRKMYERSSATEKNRSINKAMRKLFPWQVEQAPVLDPTDPVAQLKAALPHLSPAKVRELLRLLGLDPAA